MSETLQDLKDIPQEFFKDGTQFINRCTKRESPALIGIGVVCCLLRLPANLFLAVLADRREFVKISQAVGMGFLIMGAIGYFIKLSEYIYIPSLPSYVCFWIVSSSTSTAGAFRGRKLGLAEMEERVRW